MWFVRYRADRKKLLKANDRLQSRVAAIYQARECVPGRQIRRASAGACAWPAAQHCSRSPDRQLPFPRRDRAREKNTAWAQSLHLISGFGMAGFSLATILED